MNLKVKVIHICNDFFSTFSTSMDPNPDFVQLSVYRGITRSM